MSQSDWPSERLNELGRVLFRELRRAEYVLEPDTWDEVSAEDRVSYLVIAEVMARKCEELGLSDDRRKPSTLASPNT
jgi:hypothetical protein